MNRQKAEGVMHVQKAQKIHWLDYDAVSLLVLVVGIGAVSVLALSI
jgi:hypothetical protein